MSKKETIKLEDFLEDAYKAFEIHKDDIPRPKVKIYYVCSKCDEGYLKEDKFCSKDGAEVVEDKREIEHENYRSFAGDILIDIVDGYELPESFPYEFVDSIEKKSHDTSGYHMNYVFKRKSDGKFFYYSTYEHRMSSDALRECVQEKRVVWSFEKHFA